MTWQACNNGLITFICCNVTSGKSYTGNLERISRNALLISDLVPEKIEMIQKKVKRNETTKCSTYSASLMNQVDNGNPWSID